VIHFVCFYNISAGIQAKLAFSQEFRHCNVITYDGESWLVTEFDAFGYQIQMVDVRSGASLIRGMKHVPSLTALIVIDVEKKARVCWKPFMVRSCNELARYVTGANIGFTFNPKHLYNKLIKYNCRNYDILHAWRRKDGLI